MKKTLVLASLLAAFGAASAQSSVTLFGAVNVDYGTRTVRSTESAPGYSASETVKTTGIKGDSNRAGSSNAFGIRGSEALGNGLNAIFHLEGSLNVADGTANTTGFDFRRKSIVGLSGGFGDVYFGREYTPGFSLLSGSDVNGTDGHTTVGNVAASLTGLAPATAAGAASVTSAVRRSNSINFTSADYNGFKFRLQAAKNITKTSAASGSTSTFADALNTAADGGNGYGASAVYSAGRLMVGLGLDSYKTGTQSNTAYSFNKTNTTTLGGSYDFGAVKLFANYVQAKDSTSANVANNATAKATEMNLGLRIPMGALSFVAAVGQNKLTSNNGVSGAGNATSSHKGTDYVLGTDYALSPRTGVYARVSKTGALSGGYSFGGVGSTLTDSTKSSNFAIGLQHRF